MTAGENQAQPVIFEAPIFEAVIYFIFIRPFRRTRLRFEVLHQLVLRRVKSCASTESINGFEWRRRNQPWSRVAGYSTSLAKRSAQPQRLCGIASSVSIKITEQADQSCQDSSLNRRDKESRAIAYLVTYLLGGTFGHGDDVSRATTPNQLSQTAIDARCPCPIF